MKKAMIIWITLAAAPAEAKVIQHKVAAGETLQRISMQYFGTTRKWQKLFVLNKKVLKTPNSVEPGMILEIDDSLGKITTASKTEPVAPVAAEGPTAAATAAPARAPAAPVAVAPDEATSAPVVPPKKERATYPAKESSEAADVAEGEDEADLTQEKNVTFRFGSHKFIGPDL